MRSNYEMVLVFLIILSFGQEGCTPTSTPTTNEENQEDIGRGIVIGTLGSQQSDLEPPLGTSKVIGQVLKIEGGGDTDLATTDPLAILDIAVSVDDGLGPNVELGIVIQESGYLEKSLPFQVVDIETHTGTDANAQHVVRGRALLDLEVGVLEIE